MADCRKCHHLSYVNQHKLDTANKLRISYQTPEVVGCLSYPRCYTISTDNYEEFAISIGPTHQQGISKYLIRGEWLIEEEPKIMFTFVLDEAVQFNHIVMCSRISLVLEAVAFAEIALLTQFPLYQDTPIIISFLCNHSDFQRQEPWNTIGDWLPPLSSPRTPLKKSFASALNAVKKKRTTFITKAVYFTILARKDKGTMDRARSRVYRSILFFLATEEDAGLGATKQPRYTKPWVQIQP